LDLGYRQSDRAHDEPVWRRQIAPLRSGAREVRETVAAIAFIGRFVIFVAAIMAKHHLGRLWPRAAPSEAKSIAAALQRTAPTRRRAAMALAGSGAPALARGASCTTPGPKVGVLRRRASAYSRG
jgi:hypothetical protein